MDETEVLVIGAGAAGAAAAWRLAGHGLAVTCLEQGDWVAPEASPALDPDWEAIRQAGWHPNPDVRRGPADYPVDDADCPIRPLLWNGVGGSTVMWSCHIPRFHPSDFRMRTQDGVGDDWPISHADLAPYYDLNEAMMGVAGLHGNPAMPPHRAPRGRPVGVAPGVARVAAAFDRLGWHWWPADLSLDSARCNDCGPCELHCARRAKGATDLSYWPAALARGVRLVTGARVMRIESDRTGRVTGAVWRDRAGLDRRMRAGAVVLAANGLGSPRLMLLSDGPAHPAGLANRSGLVGRRLMLHPLARVTGIFAEPAEGYRGISAGSLVSHEFYETDPARGFPRGIKMQITGSNGPALTALGSLGARLPWGAGHHARFRALFGHSVGLSICSDDLPDPANRVTLSDRLADSDGLPAPKMTYRVPPEAARALDFGRARAREALIEAGAVELIEIALLRDGGFHLMGTARMGEDRETSVLDPWCQAHDAPGLWVVDGSAFVTAAAVNPTNTLQALALRAADRIAATRHWAV